MAVGCGTDPDPAVAAQAAVRQALRNDNARLLIVFSSADYDPQIIVTAITSEAPGVPLAGCSTEAVITAAGPLEHCIAVIALGGPGLSVATAVAPEATGRQRSAGAQAAACFSWAEDRPHRMLMVITDGYTKDQEVMLAGAYSVVGASVPLIGGAASPPSGQERAFQLHGTEVYRDAVVAVMMASDSPFGVGLQHGWHRVGEPLVVTQSRSGIVQSLNDQPALRTYLQHLRAPAETYTDPVAFQAYARSRPLGVTRRDGNDVRDVCSPEHFEEGWLYSSGEIPEGGLVWLMEGDPDSALAAAGRAAREAAAGTGDHDPVGLIVFDCVSRRSVLGEKGIRQEVERIAELGLPMAGMFTWGEIARTRGINAYHNLTMAVLAAS